MSLQFIFGNSGSGKSRCLYQNIIEDSMRHPKKNYLVLVPEQFTMQTQKTIVSMHPDGGILNIDVLSFQRLAYRIFEETGGELRPLLSETGKTLVLQRIAQEQEKNLKVLGQNLKRHGAVAKMKSLVSELMQYQVTGEDLELWRERAKGKPLLALKLQDIGCIYQAFEEYLRDSYVTPEPWAMPGYDSDVIMAAGAFVQGSSIELSADAPIKPPYAVYFQGGLTWTHAKLGILKSLQGMIDAGVVSMDRIRELL